MPSTSPSDPFDLARFVVAQEDSFERALGEIHQGRKQSHWMWFIFPQLRGLGRSPTAMHYGLTGAGEAHAYLEHAVLGPRLVEISEAAWAVESGSATEVFGSPDDVKLCSCVTLFDYVATSQDVFGRLIEKYFDGRRDETTLRLLEG